MNANLENTDVGSDSWNQEAPTDRGSILDGDIPAASAEVRDVLLKKDANPRVVERALGSYLEVKGYRFPSDEEFAKLGTPIDTLGFAAYLREHSAEFENSPVVRKADEFRRRIHITTVNASESSEYVSKGASFNDVVEAEQPRKSSAKKRVTR